MNDEQHAVRWPIRTMLLVLLVVIVVGAVLFGLQLRSAYEARHVTLPDGTLVEFLGTALGLAEFKYESKWQRVARFLPSVIQKRIPRSIAGMTCGMSNSLTVYLRVKSTTGAGSYPWVLIGTEDANGFRSSANYTVCSSSDSSGSIIYGVSLYGFPRRQREFMLQMLGPNGVILGTLQIQNPNSGPFPDWKPVSLPQTKTNGPVILTLQGFEAHAQGRWTNYDAKWDLQSSDPTWAKAKTKRLGFQDATGNDGFKLSPREPAWKVRTLVYRELVQDFATNEQMIFTNLVLPVPGAFTSVDQSGVCSGIQMKVLVFASAGRFGISNGVTRFMLPISQGTSGHSVSSDGRNIIETWGASTPFLLVEAKNVQPDDEIQFRVTDDQGRQAKVEMNGYASANGATRIYSPAFNAPVGAKWITVHAIVNRPLAFEFLVKPDDVVSTK